MKTFYVALCLLLSSCVFEAKRNNNIIIKGVVSNIPAIKLYLTDLTNWQIFLDSADYKNDTFSFHLNTNNFEPYFGSICFINKEGKLTQLFYQNDVLSTKEKRYGLAGFCIDKGTTVISGTFLEHVTIKSPLLKIEGSKQNIPYFQTQFDDFGWINIKDEPERKKIIKRYKSLIKQYPNSYYFLELLYNYRAQYTKSELESLLELFDNETQQFSLFKKISTYFKELPIRGMPFKNYQLKDSFNAPVNIISSNSKVNMIIFWASWCGPCRKEIPELKQLYKKYKQSGLRMVSISIDIDKEKWNSALLYEKMEWEQLFSDNLSTEKIKANYNFSAIPVIIFTNNNGMEIERFTGYEPTNFSKYKNIVEKNL